MSRDLQDLLKLPGVGYKIANVVRGKPFGLLGLKGGISTSGSGQSLPGL
ncbi:MAG: hypothetical protein LBV77_00550 [Candidatus Adiutrix intracellularis]|nr:hypothetical protein [Candidatus Adiutrix intracellularis]